MTPQERLDFFDAIEGMGDAERLSLYNFSAKKLQGTRWTSGMDLLHEAIDRVLSGSRAWKPSVPIGAFLYEAMRSVASVDRRHPERIPVPFEERTESEVRGLDDRVDEFARSPEEMLTMSQEEDIRRRTFVSAKARLEHDPLAQAVLEGLAAGMEPNEIRRAHGIGELAFKAARARMAHALRLGASAWRH